MESFEKNGVSFQRWRIGASTFTAALNHGARLLRWEIALPAGRRQVIYWPESDDELGSKINFSNGSEVAGIRGGNPILFPFPGRNYADGERFFWRDADGVKRPMPLHGLARQGRFEIEDADDAGVAALFVPDDAARAAFPYDYEFRVHYRFSELALRVELELTSRESARDIPWCAGHHFYFGLPWHDGLSRADYIVDVPAKKIWRHGADGKLVPFDGPAELPANFADPALSDAIFTRLKSNTVVFGPRGGEENVTLRIGEEPVPDAWTTLVTWTEAADSPFYCVEPWMGPPNTPALKNGLRKVAAGGVESFVVNVSLE